MGVDTYCDPETITIVHCDAKRGVSADRDVVDAFGTVYDGRPDGSTDSNEEEGQEGSNR